MQNGSLEQFQRVVNKRLARYGDTLAPVSFLNYIDNTKPADFAYEEMEFSNGHGSNYIVRSAGGCKCIHCRPIPAKKLKHLTGLQGEVSTARLLGRRISRR